MAIRPSIAQAWFSHVRNICTCGMHGRGMEVDDTPEVHAKLEACPAFDLERKTAVGEVA